MKTIGIDARLLFQTGVGTYLQNLLYHLGTIPNDPLQYRAYILPEDVSKAKRWFPTISFVVSPYKWHTFQEQIGFGIQLVKDRLDLMHFTYFGHPVWYNRPFISTIHDLTPLTHTTGRISKINTLMYGVKKQAYKAVLAHQVHKSLSIITPSQTVKEEIEAYFSNLKVNSKIVSLHEGVSFRIMDSKEKKISPLFKEPYYLYVGNYYPHKNIHRLLTAFLSVKTSKYLVLTGPDDFFQKELRKTFSDVIKNNKIRFVSSPSFQNLVSLYRHCDAVINPSLSEGFGLPLIEATYFRKPVIASEIPVFRELLGNSYYAFDPYSSASIQNAVETFEQEKKPVIATAPPDTSFKQMTNSIHTLYCTYG